MGSSTDYLIAPKWSNFTSKFQTTLKVNIWVQLKQIWVESIFSVCQQ